MYQKQFPFGDEQPVNLTLIPDIPSKTVKLASSIALTYHGYARTGSVLWALIYGLAGRLVPIAAVPIAVAQGFGEKKTP